MERTGWSLTNDVGECVLEPWLVSDHPVCSCCGGFATFYWSRSHPSQGSRTAKSLMPFVLPFCYWPGTTPGNVTPQEEGNAPTPHSLVIHSHVLSHFPELTGFQIRRVYRGASIWWSFSRL